MNSSDTIDIIRDHLSPSTGWAIDTIEPLHSNRRSYSNHLTCRVRLTGGDEHLVFVKFVSGVSKDRDRLEELVLRDNAVTSHLYAALQTCPRFAVPKPLACSRNHLMLISEHVEGTRLQDKIIRNAKLFPRRQAVAELAADCFRCGEWLRTFQAETRGFSVQQTALGSDDLLDPSTLLRLIVKRANNLRASRVIDDAELSDTIAFAQAAARSVADHESAVSGIHADFFPGNLLVRGDNVIGIDFVMFRRGSIYFDPTYFIFQLETLAAQLWFRRSVIEKLEQAFLDGYDPRLTLSAFWTTSPLFELLFLMHATGRLRALTTGPPPSVLRRPLVMRSLAALRTRVSHHVRRSQSARPR